MDKKISVLILILKNFWNEMPKFLYVGKMFWWIILTNMAFWEPWESPRLQKPNGKNIRGNVEQSSGFVEMENRMHPAH